jgi:hypothetical protein
MDRRQITACRMAVLTMLSCALFLCGCVSQPEQVRPTTTTQAVKILTSTIPVPVSTLAAAERPGGVNLVYLPDNPPGKAEFISVSSGGFTSRFGGYAFRLNRFLSAQDNKVFSMVLDVQRPDGSLVEAETGWDECSGDYFDARVDDIVIRLWSVRDPYDERMETAKIYVWDYDSAPYLKTSPFDQRPDPDARLLKATNQGYTAEYNSYRFRTTGLTYAAGIVSGMHLDVQRPDGTIVSAQAKKGERTTVDKVNIMPPYCGVMEDDGGLLTVTFYVWGEETK